MINYIEFLKVSGTCAAAIVGVLLVMQLTGELLEFKGKVVPEFMKLRKYFKRRKTERERIREAVEQIPEIKASVDKLCAHYTPERLAVRDGWMRDVDERLGRNDDSIREISEKLDRNDRTTLAMYIDNKRNAIINFADYVVDGTKPVTHEQFNRIFKSYREYEEVLQSNGMTNGEVDIAYRIISEAYEAHLKNHTFVEDVRGY